MKNFNLLVSTSRYNETNAKAELWFTLLLCNDEYPIISGFKFPGLVMASTNLDNRKVISKIKSLLRKDPAFFQFILKIIPIDFVCETDVQIISELIQTHYKDFIHDKDTFKITLKRRKNQKIERSIFIDEVARNISNPVKLENPDKIIRIEILGNISGISFLSNEDLIKVNSQFNSI